MTHGKLVRHFCERGYLVVAVAKPETVRAGILMRVSSVGQEDNYSLDQQEIDSRDYCIKMGYSVSNNHVWNDGAQKSYTLNRPGLNAAISAIKQSKIDVLVVAKYDRLSRVQWQAAIVFYQIENLYGGKIQSANAQEQFGSDSLGTLLRNIAAFVAERERELIIERTQGGRRSRALDGKIITGPYPSYGYEWADRDARHGKSTYIIDPDSAPIVIRIYQAILSGKGLRTVTAELNDDHIMCPAELHAQHGYSTPARYKGHGRWVKSTVQRIATNPLYTGVYIAFKTHTITENRYDHELGQSRIFTETKKREQGDETMIITPNGAPPIVTEEVFFAVQAALKSRQMESLRNTKYPEEAILRAGIAICGHCNGHMNVATNNDPARMKSGKPRRFTSYRCGNSPTRSSGVHCPAGYPSIGTLAIDRDIWTLIEHLFKDPKRIRTLLDAQRSLLEQDDDSGRDRRESIEGSIAKNDAQIQNATKAVMNATSDETHALWTAKLEELVALNKKLHAIIEEMDGAQEQKNMSLLHLASIEQWSQAFSETFPELTFEEKRQLFHTLRLRVRIFKRGHEPRYIVEFDLAGLRASAIKLDIPAFTDADVRNILLGDASDGASNTNTAEEDIASYRTASVGRNAPAIIRLTSAEISQILSSPTYALALT
jgi:site-specific DNA recombinase